MGHRNSVIGSLIVLCLLLLTFAGCSKAKELAPRKANEGDAP